MNKIQSKNFLLDTNIFVEAHKRYYSLKICPGFWDFLAYHGSSGELMSIDKVRDEIKVHKDDLWNWVQHAPSSLFVSSGEESVQHEFIKIMTWVNSQPFKPEAKADFFKGADGWLIAYTMAHGITLVTDEKFNPNIQKRVPIPNVCREFDVEYINTFSMLSKLQAQFNWTP